MGNIILASKSPRRREILASAGIKFKVITEEADESCSFDVEPSFLVMGLASRKLRAVSDDVRDDDIIIAADTIVCYDGIVLGKPADDADAFRMLTMLSGDYHEVYTGIAIGRGDVMVHDYEVTRVKLRVIEPEEIEAYIKTGEAQDKAGAYAIQEAGGIFVERIEGNYHNVVGLPLCLVCKYLRDMFDCKIL